MPPIIKVTNLSKSYIINHEGTERYTALRDVMTNKAKKLFSFPKNLSTTKRLNDSTTEEFWALKDINFEIEQGDRVGIIGRNGAGKSTLLKILSRITEPTKGRIELNGRVASLLEVGTGFHPELTGRENIFLNGAILGMSRAEIKRKFDEIVDFAEVERFLDTPVKRYSSGMYVRLAFAVAAHLEPEILIVDEVLAVGDAQFQKKCLGKMEDVSKNEGRTVLFVSHDLSAVSNLCSFSMQLNLGKIQEQGETSKIINSYLSSKEQIRSIILENRTDRVGLLRLKIIDYELLGGKGGINLIPGDDLLLTFKIINTTNEEIKGVKIDLGFNNYLGNRIAWISSSLIQDNKLLFKPHETRKVSFVISELMLAPGDYSITIFLEASNGVEDWIKEAIYFSIEPSNFYGSGKLPPRNEGNLLIKFITKNEVCN